jgi:hypothetical protein
MAVEDTCSDGPDRLLDARHLMSREIVQNDDIAR